MLTVLMPLAKSILNFLVSLLLVDVVATLVDGTDLNTHRATNEHGPRLNAVGEYPRVGATH